MIMHRRMCHCVTAEDATLSRHSGIEIEQLSLQNRLSTNHSGEVRMCVHIHTVTYVQSYIHVTFILVKYVCAYIYTQLRTFSHTYMLHSFWRSTYVRTYTHSYVRSVVHTCYNHSGEVRMCVHIHTVTYVQSYIHLT